MRWVDGTSRRELGPDDHGFVTLWGAPPVGFRTEPPEPGPQAFLSEEGNARPAVQTHFHQVAQYHLAVRGEATFGRDPLPAGHVHYVDRHTPYGPIRYGEPGYAYVTLRATPDPGPSYMPEASDELAAVLASGTRAASDRRHTTIDLAGAPASDGWTDLMTEDDGVRVAVAVLGPDEAASPLPVSGSGAWVTVVEGSILDGTATVDGPGGLTWAAPGTELRPVAGPAGARVALLQLPLDA